MKGKFTSAVAALALLALACAAPASAKDSLYKQLGGYDAIAAVTDAFLSKATGDQTLKRFFVGHNQSALKAIRQHIVDFICEKAGGPCVYTGRQMKEAHTGLKITGKDWDASNKIFGTVMADLKVPAPLQKEVVAFIGSLKADIVGQ
jgi:hemoglobin